MVVQEVSIPLHALSHFQPPQQLFGRQWRADWYIKGWLTAGSRDLAACLTCQNPVPDGIIQIMEMTFPPALQTY